MQISKLEDVYSLSSKITRKEMVEKYQNFFKIDLANKQEPMKYVDQYTGKVKNEICTMRKVCPLCNSEHFTFLFIKHGFDHMLCNSCDLIFTLQVLDVNKIKFLQTGNEGNIYGEIKADPIVNEYDRKKFEIVFEQIEKFSKIQTIFDFGSQVGTFLDWAKEKYKIVGHEYHDAIREGAKQKGHTILNENLETIKLDQEFDLITCWDYIDHVLNPIKVIKNLSKYLKKNGLFFYAINNRDSLANRIMHRDSPHFVGPHHTMHYGIKQLELLMNDYELLHVESYVSELNWLSNWLNFENPGFGDSPLMFELFDPKRVCELGMGMKLNAIFKKIDN